MGGGGLHFVPVPVVHGYCHADAKEIHFFLQRSVNLEDRLQRQIIVADTIMYQAILTFIDQTISSYVKGRSKSSGNLFRHITADSQKHTIIAI